jgi:hypothetical protein
LNSSTSALSSSLLFTRFVRLFPFQDSVWIEIREIEPSEFIDLTGESAGGSDRMLWRETQYSANEAEQELPIARMVLATEGIIDSPQPNEELALGHFRDLFSAVSDKCNEYDVKT